jgi:hypothetical protein
VLIIVVPPYRAQQVLGRYYSSPVSNLGSVTAENLVLNDDEDEILPLKEIEVAGQYLVAKVLYGYAREKEIINKYFSSFNLAL